MELFFLIVVIFIFLVLDGLILWWFFKRKKKLSESAKQKIQTQLAKLDSISEHEQILELDKLLDFVLQNIGISGKNMGDRMKKYGKSFRNENAVWFAHKLRNMIAHEVGVSFSKKDFEKAKQAFLAEIKSFF